MNNRSLRNHRNAVLVENLLPPLHRCILSFEGDIGEWAKAARRFKQARLSWTAKSCRVASCGRIEAAAEYTFRIRWTDNLVISKASVTLYVNVPASIPVRIRGLIMLPFVRNSAFGTVYKKTPFILLSIQGVVE